MSERELKREKIFDLLNAKIKLKKISEIICVSLWPQSSPDRNSLRYSLWGVLENKTNATSHQNIGSLKTAIKEEWNKESEEFILKACKSFRRRVDNWKKWRLYWVNLQFLLSFSLVCCLFFKFRINLVLLYNLWLY